MPLGNNSQNKIQMFLVVRSAQYTYTVQNVIALRCMDYCWCDSI